MESLIIVTILVLCCLLLGRKLFRQFSGPGQCLSGAERQTGCGATCSGCSCSSNRL